MKEPIVIIPTTGSETLRDALYSIANQTIPVTPLVVVDGKEFASRTVDIVRRLDVSSEFKTEVLDNLVVLPENVGGGGFYGQRIYAAFSYLVNSDYILFLDEDNWFEPDHVQSMINKIQLFNLDWTYSLRNIYSKDKEFLVRDDCESLGRWNPFTDYQFVDNNCYCFKRETLIKVAPFLYGGWGQDRVLYKALVQLCPIFECTGKYTTNYRLDGNEGSVKLNFFEFGNTVSAEKYAGTVYPWRS